MLKSFSRKIVILCVVLSMLLPLAACTVTPDILIDDDLDTTTTTDSSDVTTGPSDATTDTSGTTEDPSDGITTGDASDTTDGGSNITTTRPSGTTPEPDVPAEPKYILVFRTNGGSSLNRVSLTFAELQAYQLPKPVRVGYGFVGWYSDSGLTTEFVLPNVAPTEDTTLTLYAKWIEGVYTVQVNFNRDSGYTRKGGNLTQTISDGDAFKSITVTTKLGYEFAYYEVDGTKYNSSKISLSNINRDMTVNVRIDYATEELPIINIKTNEDITSKELYTPMTFSTENCAGELTDVTGGIRLRGNTTASFSKKPYRIKFDQKQSLFGLESAKSWVLLADYLDPSSLHNHAALTFGNATDGLRFTPTPHKVNVYLNGSFEGLYTLCEQIQENPGRLDIEMQTDVNGLLPETLTNLSDYNFLVAIDRSTAEADPNRTLENQKYFLLTRNGEEYCFDLKYPERESFATEKQYKSFFNQLKSYIISTLDLIEDGSYSEVNKTLDLTSLADYYIIDSMMMCKDHRYKSFNMWYTADSGKLHFGPIWDYDYSLFVDWTSKPNQQYSLKGDDIQEMDFYKNIYMKVLDRFDETTVLVKQRYADVFEPVWSSYIASYDGLVASMEESMELNRQKWYSSLPSDIVSENIQFMKTFFDDRKAVLDEVWELSSYQK